jgi:predicted ribosomally synthesized peptide with nif11-like leader
MIYMSLESAKKFVEKMQKDEIFAKSFFACSDPEARKAFIKEAGFEFTKDEIDEARAGLNVSGGGCCGILSEIDKKLGCPACDTDYCGGQGV